MKPIGATRSGAGPIAAGIMTGEIPPDMGRAWRRVQVTDVESCARLPRRADFSSVSREEDTNEYFLHHRRSGGCDFRRGLCENVSEPRMHRIVFSIAFSR